MLLDSDRSECIDFTVIFSVWHQYLDSWNDPILDISILNDRKMNLVGTLEKSKLKIPNSFLNTMSALLTVFRMQW